MDRRSQTLGIISTVLLLTCFFAATASAQSAPAAARAVVSSLYAARSSPFFQTKNRALVDKYFTKELADMIWKDAVTSKGEVGAIDGDPLYNAQDKKIRDLVIGNAVVKEKSATVKVTFTNFGKKQAIEYRVEKTPQGWRIDDIVYDDDNSLRKWLKQT